MSLFKFKRPRLFTRLLVWILVLFLSFLGILITKISFWEIFEVPSESMLPTFRISDLVLVDKSHYTFKLPWQDEVKIKKIPDYGDIIVFIHPQTQEYYVKRVVGKPGDIVMTIGQRVWVNGDALEVYGDVENEEIKYWPEHWNGSVDIRSASINVDGNVKKYRLLWSKNNRSWSFSGYWKVPDNSLFVIGDWRDESSDSRSWGFIPFENIVGKPVCVYDGGSRTGLNPIKHRTDCNIDN